VTPSFNLVGRLFNAPVALREASRDVAVGLLAEWVAATRSGAMKALAEELREARDWTPYDIVADVAIIPIRGVLIQRVGELGWWAEYLGIAGYDDIRLKFLQALADPDVKAIVFSIDSPGGDVAGCFDLVDTIFAARGTKPIAAILGESAYSAAYALASAVDPGRLYVPRTGGTGSVGVIYMHVSIEKALEKNGFEVTLVTKGSRKAEGNEYSALSEQALAAIQADVDEIGALFDRTVARNRGLDAAKVSATEAATFMGAAGVDIGFADKVMAPDAAFRALLAELG
jgi:ClpP class serine protease